MITPEPIDPVRAAEPAATKPTATKPLVVALVTTIAVTLASALVPERFAATAVGVTFLFATWLFVLRHDEGVIRDHGLSLGGVLEPQQLSARRIARDAASALGWALLFAAIVFPPFLFGYRGYWHTHHAFVFRLPKSVLDEVAGQLVVIALPEEAFFRGYLQSELDRAWRPRWRVLGADLGPGWIASAAIFAVGHFLTIRSPARLAVFFPALLFGLLRARTKGIGAGVVFHAACNVFSASLARGYGLAV